MNCTVGKWSPGPEEATAGNWGPWLDVAAEASERGHKVESLARESEIEALAARGRALERVEQPVVAIEQRKVVEEGI
jgi:hypothetical protein